MYSIIEGLFMMICKTLYLEWNIILEEMLTVLEGRKAEDTISRRETGEWYVQYSYNNQFVECRVKQLFSGITDSSGSR